MFADGQVGCRYDPAAAGAAHDDPKPGGAGLLRNPVDRAATGMHLAVPGQRGSVFGLDPHGLGGGVGDFEFDARGL